MGEPGRYREERERLSARCSGLRLPSFSVPAVETVVEKFREAKARSAAFKSFIPRRSRLSRTTQGPGPSPSGDQRWAQKVYCRGSCPSPPPAGRGRGWRGSKRGRQDLEGGESDKAVLNALVRTGVKN